MDNLSRFRVQWRHAGDAFAFSRRGSVCATPVRCAWSTNVSRNGIFEWGKAVVDLFSFVLCERFVRFLEGCLVQDIVWLWMKYWLLFSGFFFFYLSFFNTIQHFEEFLRYRVTDTVWIFDNFYFFGFVSYENWSIFSFFFFSFILNKFQSSRNVWRYC